MLKRVSNYKVVCREDGQKRNYKRGDISRAQKGRIQVSILCCAVEGYSRARNSICRGTEEVKGHSECWKTINTTQERKETQQEKKLKRPGSQLSPVTY